MTTRRLSLLALLTLLLSLPGCQDEYDPTKFECGYPGNCCWSDNTCNAGYACNTQTQKCMVAPDQGPTDLLAPDATGRDSQPPIVDTGRPDSAPHDAAPETGSDAEPQDQGGPDGANGGPDGTNG